VRSRYIVGPVYDWVFFLMSPVVALALGILISGTDFADTERTLWTAEDTAAGLILSTIIHAHLVAVFFRSHGNRDIFKTHPLRFTLVPALLWLGFFLSPWLAVAGTVVATFWDVWHSGAQTFGFARIYDRNHGVPPELGRRLDFWLNQLLYFGPILAGATLMDHVDSFDSFADVGDAFFAAVPAHVEGHRAWLFWAVVGAGTLFLLYYVAFHVRMWHRGYRPSFEKVFLLSATGFCSIYTWGWNTWGEAFFIMNLFHAVQYLALVWAKERENIQRVFFRARPTLALALFLASVLGYGFAVQFIGSHLAALWSITLVVSLMHFWYDAFVWSVRKKQI